MFSSGEKFSMHVQYGGHFAFGTQLHLEFKFNGQMSDDLSVQTICASSSVKTAIVKGLKLNNKLICLSC